MPGYRPSGSGGAHRFRVAASLAGRLFETFLLDVGMSTVAIDDHETLTSDFLSFAEVAPVEIPAIPLEWHLGEKLHAYTRRYRDDQPTSRAKDLIDIVLISELASFELERLREVVVRLFEGRATHDLPSSIPAPPSEWVFPYRALAEEVGLDPDPSVGHRLAAAFLDPVLAPEPGLDHWDVDALRWRRG